MQRLKEAMLIDRIKANLEEKHEPKIKRIFNNIANDVFILMKGGRRIDAENLAENYKTDFTKEIRDVMRDTIKQLGFTLRNKLQNKNQGNFKTKSQQDLFENYHILKAVDLSQELKDEEDKINKEFLALMILLISNNSEKNADLITKTNAKMILEAQELASEKLNEKIRELDEAEVAGFFDEIKTEKIKQERNVIEQNKNEILAIFAREKIKQDGKNRSKLITDQTVGQTESIARQTEAQLVNKALPNLRTFKTWNAILDSKTREAHAEADGQVVDVNSSFIVDGEELSYPRDENGSAGNTINCRCIASYEVGENS